jgi:hypothetical protein
VIDSVAVSAVDNSQPAGIGRVVSLRRGCAWNNLGRNVVFADDALRPLAIFGETDFVDQDEPSQFDLDVHAILELGGGSWLATVNHLGLVRLFDPPTGDRGVVTPGPGYRPLATLDYQDDLERVVAVGSRLVSSRPRGRRQAGLLVSGALRPGTGQVDGQTVHESFGFVSALASSADAQGNGWIAMGGERSIRLAQTADGVPVTTCWESELDFSVHVIVAGDGALWAAGSAPGAGDLDDYDWELLRGGGLAKLSLSDGEVLREGSFAAEVAWGSGGVPFVVFDDVPIAVGRSGALQTLGRGASETVCFTEPLSTERLGIAHAVVVADQVVVGFNRGGYRLYTFETGALHHLSAGLGDRRA